ncbi:Beta-glucosidase 12 [Sesamum angolense]|uniref:Beta-glucosidase 12 n=1 Tax=Sesamum angolense TaxID=2727404 RepID=A0AAE1W0W5_9LAMI|nr:Beta-glucosidase 12 [Sesamum angolense]
MREAMATRAGYTTLKLALFLVCSSFASTAVSGLTFNDPPAPQNRSSFPEGFVFGVGSSAYQYEGAAFEGGRGQSVWDTFTHKFPGRIRGGGNGDVADNFYYLYKDDIKLMKSIGLDAFRMSISWSRVLPRGKLSGGVNKEGIEFYNNVFNELLANVMILEILLSFASKNLAIVLRTGSHIMSQLLMPLVAMTAMAAIHREDAPPGLFVPKGIQQLSLMLPLTISSFPMQQSSNYTRRNIRFIHPLVYGEYPKIMQSVVGSRLPKFTKEQSAMLKGSFDFLGLNYYTAYYAADIPHNTENISSTTDPMVKLSSYDISGVAIGNPTELRGVFVSPKGLYDLLIYTKTKYKNPTIYITETGIPDRKDGPIKRAIEDLHRIDFYNIHFSTVQEAIRKGVKVKGIFGWSFLDNFEWASGYDIGYGFFYVDFKNELKRIPKLSAIWFKNFLNKSGKGMFAYIFVPCYSLHVFTL